MTLKNIITKMENGIIYCGKFFEYAIDYDCTPDLCAECALSDLCNVDSRCGNACYLHDKEHSMPSVSGYYLDRNEETSIPNIEFGLVMDGQVHQILSEENSSKRCFECSLRRVCRNIDDYIGCIGTAKKIN